MNLTRKFYFFKMLIFPTFFQILGGIGLGVLVYVLSERVKVKNTMIAAYIIVVGVIVIFLIVNILLLITLRKFFSNKSTKETITEKLIKRLNTYPRKLYITSFITCATTPILFVVVQVLKKVPLGATSIAMSSIGTLGIGIIVSTLHYLYIIPLNIKISMDFSIPYKRIQLKYKILFPIINFFIIMLSSLSFFGYMSSRMLYEKPRSEKNLYFFKYKIAEVEKKYKIFERKDKQELYLKTLRNENILFKDFYFIFNKKGIIIDSSFKDTIGKHSLVDIEKKSNVTNNFTQTIKKLLSQKEGIADIYYNQTVYYAFYHHIEGTNLYILSGELSSKFFATADTIGLYMILIGWLVLMIITVYSLLSTTKKFKPLKELSSIFDKMSKGDMSNVNIKTKYAVGDEISDMIAAQQRLGKILVSLAKGLKAFSIDLGEIAGVIDTTSQKISEDTQGQATTVEEFSASVEEIASSIEMISSNVKKQYEKTQSVYNSIESFTKSMEEISKNTSNAEEIAEVAYSNVTKIDKDIETTVSEIKLIGESSKKVAETLSVIKEISDQINLLSLNASIEAARAGDAGRGFAVVADEVGKLAEKTTHETNEIEKQVFESSRRVEQGVNYILNISESMKTMTETVRNTSDIIIKIAYLSKAFGDETGNIFNQVKALTTISDENRVATEEQLLTTKEIIITIDNMNRSLQQTVEGVMNFVSIVDKLSEHSKKIKEMLANIRTE